MGGCFFEAIAAVRQAGEIAAIATEPFALSMEVTLLLYSPAVFLTAGANSGNTSVTIALRR
jgi:hypothetical protein